MAESPLSIRQKVWKGHFNQRQISEDMSSILFHEREQDSDDLGPTPKRVKLDDNPLRAESVLPPSHALLNISLPTASPGQPINFTEADVGISEYVSEGLPKIEAIIKQRQVSD